MAKIQEELIIIKLSRLIKDNEKEPLTTMAGKDIQQAVEQVVQELVGENIIVEIEET
jgi:hypothetical protein